MAIQLGVIQFRGKVGQIVGRKKSKAQKANSIAAYQPTVSNPKSVLQREQRVKMLPALNFYRALAEILNHSWQGVEYGGASYNFFMKQAMLQNDLFPYLVKGDTRAVPGNYLISKGGLPAISDVTFGFDDITGNAFINSPILHSFGTNEVVAAASQDILNQSFGLENGDQLTFVVCIPSSDNVAEDDCFFTYKVFRFIIDTESLTPLSDWAQSQGVTFSDEHDGLSIVATDTPAVAGAIIVSRPPRTTGGAWQRSTTRLSISGDIQSIFMGSTARLAAMESYAAKVANTSSDWYLNQGTSGGSAAQTTATVTITRTPEAGGTVTGAGSYEIGEAVTVAATSAAGYVFEGWYRDGVLVSNHTSYQFVLGSNITLEARFSMGDEP